MFFHLRTVRLIDLGLDLENTVLRRLLREDLVVAADNGQMIRELLVEIVVVTLKLLYALSHEVAKLEHFLFGRQQL